MAAQKKAFLAFHPPAIEATVDRNSVQINAAGYDVWDASLGGGSPLGAGPSIIADVSDTAESIRQKLADRYREIREDQDIIVIFIDASGRY